MNQNTLNTWHIYRKYQSSINKYKSFFPEIFHGPPWGQHNLDILHQPLKKQTTHIDVFWSCWKFHIFFWNGSLHEDIGYWFKRWGFVSGCAFWNSCQIISGSFAPLNCSRCYEQGSDVWACMCVLWAIVCMYRRLSQFEFASVVRASK